MATKNNPFSNVTSMPGLDDFITKSVPKALNVQNPVSLADKVAQSAPKTPTTGNIPLTPFTGLTNPGVSFNTNPGEISTAAQRVIDVASYQTPNYFTGAGYTAPKLPSAVSTYATDYLSKSAGTSTLDRLFSAGREDPTTGERIGSFFSGVGKDALAGYAGAYEAVDNLSGNFEENLGASILYGKGSTLDDVSDRTISRLEAEKKALENELENVKNETTDSGLINPVFAETSKRNNILRLEQEISEIDKQIGTQSRLKATSGSDNVINLATSAQEDIARTKQGMGAFGSTLVDVGSTGLQMLGDIGVGVATGGVVNPVTLSAIRAGGSAATQATAEGATADQAAMRGALGFASTWAISRLFNVSKASQIFTGTTGASTTWVNDLVAKAASKLSGTASGQQALKQIGTLLASGATEGVEEMLETALSPALDALTYAGAEALSDYTSADYYGELLYSGLLGGTIGLLGGGVDVVTGAIGNKNTTQTSTDANTNTAQAEFTPISAQGGIEGTDTTLAKTSLQDNTEAQNADDVLSQPAQKGKTLTDEQVGELYVENFQASTKPGETYFKGVSPPNPVFQSGILTSKGQTTAYELKKMQYEYGLQLSNELRNYGIKDVIIEPMAQGVTGYYSNGVVHVSSALDSTEAITEKVAHEISHAAIEGDATFTADILTAVGESGIDVQGLINEKLETYSNFFRQQGMSEAQIAQMVTMRYAADEVAADYIGALMKNDYALSSLQNKPTLIQRIINAIQRLVKGKSAQERAQYTALADKLRAVAGVAPGKSAGLGVSGGGVRYSINPEFSAELDAWDGKSKKVFNIGTTSEPLQSIGIKDRKFIWHGRKINKILRDHPGMNKEIIKQVPNILENPVIVLKSESDNTKKDRAVVFGELYDTNGYPVLSALELEPDKDGGELLNLNIIASAYGKDNNPQDFIKKSDVLYLDPNKNRTENWMQSVGLQLPSDANSFGSVGSVTYDGGDVKIKGVPFSEYMSGGEADVRYSIESKADGDSNNESGTGREAGKSVRKLLRKYSSTADAEGIQSQIDALADYVQSGETKDRDAWAKYIAENVVDNAVQINNDVRAQYDSLRNYLRNTQIHVSDSDAANIADYNHWRKNQFNRLKLKKAQTSNIDQVYQELSQMYPEFFSEENVSNPADQLLSMVDALDEVSDVFEYNPFANDKASAVEAVSKDIISSVDEVLKQRTKEDIKRERSVDELKTVYKDIKTGRKELQSIKDKIVFIGDEASLINNLAIGKINESDIPQSENHDNIIKAANEQKALNKNLAIIAQFNARRKNQLRELADKHLTNVEEFKDKKSGIQYARETIERNIRDITPNKEVADSMIETYATPVHAHEAESTKFKNEFRAKVRALKLSRKIAKGDKHSESAAVQILGEADYNIGVLENKTADAKSNGYTIEEWSAAKEDVLMNNPNMDFDKIDNAIKELHTMYDHFFERMNEVRIANGYEPVDYRGGYFPHFSDTEGDGLLAKIGRRLGIQTEVTELPTSINGLTHTFRPGTKWASFVQQRLGYDTTYDAVKGFDRYIEGVSDIIFHTEDIQKLRVLSDQIRYITGSDGLREQIDAIRSNPDMDPELKEMKERELKESGKFMLSNFVVELEEYTNLLAGKKAFADRNMEREIGRKSYDLVKALEGNVAANMVAVNPGSWLTNFIPLSQGWATLDTKHLLNGMASALKSMKTDDGFGAASDFITNRRGSDPIVSTWRQDATKVLSRPMAYIDSFVSESLVRARYEQNKAEAIKNGETVDTDAAMQEADAWTAGVMADRSKGSMPTLFERRNPITKLFTQFQLEVNNQLSFLFKDIPRETREKGVAVLTGAFIKFFLGAFMFNEAYEYFIGRRPALDPIGILNDAVGDLTGFELPNTIEAVQGLISGEGVDLETEKLNLAEGGVNLATNVAESLPFIGGLLGGGRLPISSAIPDVGTAWDATANLISGEGDALKQGQRLGKELMKPITYMLPPFGGGQAKKIYEGITAVANSGKYGIDNEGKEYLQYAVENNQDPLTTGLNAVRASLFGTTSLQSGREWIESGFESFDATETEVYRQLVDNGMKEGEAYDIISKIKEAEPGSIGIRENRRVETKADAMSRVLKNLDDVSNFHKDVLYYGLVANKNEQIIMDELDRIGAVYGTASKTFMDMKTREGEKEKEKVLLDSDLAPIEKDLVYSEMFADGTDLAIMSKLTAEEAKPGEASRYLIEFSNAEDSDEKRQLLLDADLSDEHKEYIYLEKISSSKSTVERIDLLTDAGFSFDDYLITSNMYYEVQDDDSLNSAQKSARLLSLYTEGGYSPEDIGILTYNNSSFDSYNEMIKEGVGGQSAAQILEAFAGLTPRPGEDWPDEEQKIVAITELGLSEAERFKAYEAIGSIYKSTTDEMKVGLSFGIDDGFYAKFNGDVMPKYNFDGNNSYKQSEVTAALQDQNMSNEEKSIIWQLITDGSPSNNPFNSAIGAQVKAELQAAKDARSASEIAEDTANATEQAGSANDSPFLTFARSNEIQASEATQPSDSTLSEMNSDNPFRQFAK